MLKRFRKFQEDKPSWDYVAPTENISEDAAFHERIAAAVERQEARHRELDHRYYAGVALRAMIDKWDGDPEKGRFVIAHKAHLIADAMVNADWGRREQSDGR